MSVRKRYLWMAFVTVSFFASAQGKTDPTASRKNQGGIVIQADAESVNQLLTPHVTPDGGAFSILAITGPIAFVLAVLIVATMVYAWKNSPGHNVFAVVSGMVGVSIGLILIIFFANEDSWLPSLWFIGSGVWVWTLQRNKPQDVTASRGSIRYRSPSVEIVNPSDGVIELRVTVEAEYGNELINLRVTVLPSNIGVTLMAPYDIQMWPYVRPGDSVNATFRVKITDPFVKDVFVQAYATNAMPSETKIPIPQMQMQFRGV